MSRQKLVGPVIRRFLGDLHVVDMAFSNAGCGDFNKFGFVVHVLDRGTATVTHRCAYTARHLEHEPSLVAAAKWIAGEKLEHEQFHLQVQRALDHAVKPLTRYRCAACGFEAKQHFWQCPGCLNWDTYPPRHVEEL